MLAKANDSIYTAATRDGVSITNVELQPHPSSRATRLVGDSTRFLLLSVSKNVSEQALRERMPVWIREGININGIA